MAKIQTCDNWLAQLLVCAIVMIYGNSVHISTLKKPMCDIWKAKMFSVIFCQLQTTVSVWSVTFFRCVDSLPISPIWNNWFRGTYIANNNTPKCQITCHTLPKLSEGKVSGSTYIIIKYYY